MSVSRFKLNGATCACRHAPSLTARLDERDQVIDNKRLPGHLQPGLFEIFLGVTIEARAKRPFRPRLLKPREQQAKAAAGTGVIEKPQDSAWL
jgi:hypothetical protein